MFRILPEFHTRRPPAASNPRAASPPHRATRANTLSLSTGGIPAGTGTDQGTSFGINRRFDLLPTHCCPKVCLSALRARLSARPGGQFWGLHACSLSGRNERCGTRGDRVQQMEATKRHEKSQELFCASGALSWPLPRRTPRPIATDQIASSSLALERAQTTCQLREKRVTFEKTTRIVRVAPCRLRKNEVSVDSRHQSPVTLPRRAICGTYPMRREFEDFWNTGGQRSPCFSEPIAIRACQIR